MKKIINFLKRKPIVILLLITILIIALLVYSPKSLIKTPPFQTNQNLPFGSLPQPSINPFSNTPSPLSAVSQFKESFLPQSISVYKLPSYSSQETINFFTPIAKEIGFTQTPENKIIDNKPYLLWKSDNGHFLADQQTGYFNFKTNLSQNSNNPPITKKDSLYIAQKWLERHRLVSSNTPSQIIPLVIYGQTLEPAPETNQPDAFKIDFSPTINKFPLFNTVNNESTIIITIDTQGKIISGFYNPPAILISSILQNKELITADYPIKTYQQITEDIKNGLLTITSIKQSDGQYLLSTIPLSNISYNKTELGYSTNPQSNYLIPIFKLTGTAKTQANQQVIIEAYMPATNN